MIWMLLVLALPLVALLIRPVWFREQEQQQSDENLRLYQERTAELAAGDLPEDEKAALQLELDREFLASADAAEEQLRATEVRSTSLPGGIAVVVFSLLLVVGLYQIWGADNELRATALLDKGEQVELTLPERAELMDRLAEAARHNHKNLEWAYLNARLLSANGQYEQAVVAFEQVLEQLPDDAEADRAATLALMAESRFFAAGQKADETTYALLQQALDINPNSRQALGLAGIMAFELGKVRDALEYWKVLWLGLPEGPESQVLAQGIQRAAERLQADGEEVDLGWLQRATIPVRVSLSEQALAAVEPGDLVFILARAASGPPMPLAVQRVTVADLPLELTLSDAMAMAPGMNLSTFDQVMVAARVSKSGQPVASAGDWQVEVGPISNRSEDTIELVIDTLVE